jgi:hypothetical protein
MEKTISKGFYFFLFYLNFISWDLLVYTLFGLPPPNPVPPPGRTGSALLFSDLVEETT